MTFEWVATRTPAIALAPHEWRKPRVLVNAKDVQDAASTVSLILMREGWLDGEAIRLWIWAEDTARGVGGYPIEIHGFELSRDPRSIPGRYYDARPNYARDHAKGAAGD